MNKFMRAALNEAKKAYSKREVPVGAIIVKDDVIIAKAHNLREHKNTSLAHAEILAIEKACKRLKSWRLDGCTMYVTLEPCLMCAGAITQSRIKNVVIGALDEKNGVIESIANVFDIKTTTKVEYEIENTEECSKIISTFFKELRNYKKLEK
ncbi:MAG: CMP/dCMP deaminase zinc-binding [Clostridia bacterium]|jgi:tRNA(adenine34) deaminase|nr:CMP/dCMP deaminase zinc-binding [Clostridia bacterium]